MAYREETAAPVIKKANRPGSVEPDPIHGLIESALEDQNTVVEYEPDPELRDTEQIPLLQEGGIDAFLEKEVLPYAPDARYVPDSVKVGCDMSFTRRGYKPQPLRPLEGDTGRHPGFGAADGGAAGGDCWERHGRLSCGSRRQAVCLRTTT